MGNGAAGDVFVVRCAVPTGGGYGGQGARPMKTSALRLCPPYKFILFAENPSIGARDFAIKLSHRADASYAADCYLIGILFAGDEY